jgi:CIC family chloride channel protein
LAKDHYNKQLSKVHSRKERPDFRETLADLGLAMVLGALSALAAVAFRAMINGLQTVLFDGGFREVPLLGHYYIILVPASGGLVVGLIIHFLSPEAKGNGIPQVMKAIAVSGGRIRPVVAAAKALAASICIGSGGSAGREGPIVQISASLGSSLGQWFRLHEDRIRLLVACGAAGGIAATFNAPIAGALFALEIVLRRVVTPVFAYVFLSAITAAYTASLFFGKAPLFTLPVYQLADPMELFLYALLGLVCAVIAVAFIRALYGFSDAVNTIKIPGYIKPAIGGLLVGLIGLYNVNVLGLGYSEIQKILTTDFSIGFLAVMSLLKLTATSFTLGSGGSGGIFSPSLFIGASLGTAFAAVLRRVMPFSMGPGGAYGVVAMAAFFGAATRAPFTAVIIIFEITQSFDLVLPLMTAVSLSTAFSSLLTKGTIYTSQLQREGVNIDIPTRLD